MPESQYEFDVALSFAGEDRAYVDTVASHLKKLKIRVFYDRYERADLWGKDLNEHLADVYGKKSQYVVLFISKHYAHKVWTNHERRSAQARALTEKGEYILPARFDDTEVPGLHATVGYLNIAHMAPAELARNIEEKLKRRDTRDESAPMLLLKAGTVIVIEVIVFCTYLGMKQLVIEDNSAEPYFAAIATILLMLFFLTAPWIWSIRERRQH